MDFYHLRGNIKSNYLKTTSKKVVHKAGKFSGNKVKR